MRKPNNEPALHRSEFPILLLKALDDDHEQISKACDFFREHFTLTTDHEVYDDDEYRTQFVSHLEQLGNLAYPNRLFKEVDIIMSIDEAIEALQKKREEATHG